MVPSAGNSLEHDVCKSKKLIIWYGLSLPRHTDCKSFLAKPCCHSLNLYRPVATIGKDLGFQAFVRQNGGMDCAETVLVANTEYQNDRRNLYKH